MFCAHPSSHSSSYIIDVHDSPTENTNTDCPGPIPRMLCEWWRDVHHMLISILHGHGIWTVSQPNTMSKGHSTKYAPASDASLFSDTDPMAAGPVLTHAEYSTEAGDRDSKVCA